MNTIKVKKDNTLMIAHQGLSGLEPENSIPAFIAAGNRSYYGVETDVHVTKDGEFVIIHDDKTGRVANKNIIVAESTFDEIRSLTLHNLSKDDLANGITPETAKNRPDLIFPSLADYVNICKKYDKKCVLELKNVFDPADIKRMVAQIQELDYLDDVIFISFSIENMKCLRELLPNQTLQYLEENYNEEVLALLNKYNLDLDVRHRALTKEVIDEVHANGHTVNAWTVDTTDRAEQLISWGVDFITSNFLE